MSGPQFCRDLWIYFSSEFLARLHGSYEALAYTSSAEVFSELSGGVTERVPLPFGSSNEMIDRLRTALHMTVIVTAVAVSSNGSISESWSFQLLSITVL